MASPRKKLASEAARLLGQLGGRRGGLASAAALTEHERQERARAAVSARWARKGARKKGLPVDQAAVMARLEDGNAVTLPIAPGGGGKRRRAAIATLERNGQLTVLGGDSTSVTLVKGDR